MEIPQHPLIRSEHKERIFGSLTILAFSVGSLAFFQTRLVASTILAYQGAAVLNHSINLTPPSETAIYLLSPPIRIDSTFLQRVERTLKIKNLLFAAFAGLTLNLLSRSVYSRHEYQVGLKHLFPLGITSLTLSVLIPKLSTGKIRVKIQKFLIGSCLTSDDFKETFFNNLALISFIALSLGILSHRKTSYKFRERLLEVHK
ncbi:MAG: hypothetical protein KDK64_00335 [Chlamydiia bacterium]|nr:hypothetical protein [Chlamydiia bacterium]